MSDQRLKATPRTFQNVSGSLLLKHELEALCTFDIFLSSAKEGICKPEAGNLPAGLPSIGQLSPEPPFYR
jgi:hypothetical protein